MTIPRRETVDVSTLTIDPTNARRHPERNLDAIEASLRRFGQRRAIQVRAADRVVIAGNGTLEVIRDRLGWSEVDVELWDDDPDTARAYAIVDNRSAELAEWNEDVLAGSIDALADVGFDPELLGFTPKERRLLADRMSIDVAQDQVPTKPTNPVTRRGDTWRLGPHRLHCGDTTDAALVEKIIAAHLDGDRLDLIFTSPPYNVGKPYRSSNDRGSWPDYRASIERTVAAWVRHLAPGRLVAWNVGTSPKTRPHEHFAILEEAGLDFHRQMIWQKVGVPVPSFHHTRSAARARIFSPNYTHEVIGLFTKYALSPGGPIVRSLGLEERHELVGLFVKGFAEPGGHVVFGDALEHDVFTIAQSAAGREAPEGDEVDHSTNLETRKTKAHPAPFPVALPAAFMVHLADVDAWVADPYMGSGSTIIAAEQVDRRSLGFELDPGYCDVTVERWEALTGAKAKRGRL